LAEQHYLQVARLIDTDAGMQDIFPATVLAAGAGTGQEKSNKSLLVLAKCNR